MFLVGANSSTGLVSLHLVHSFTFCDPAICLDFSLLAWTPAHKKDTMKPPHSPQHQETKDSRPQTYSC